jgi:hypothetical protein
MQFAPGPKAAVVLFFAVYGEEAKLPGGSNVRLYENRE